MPLPALTLVLGGARSGKSRYAQARCAASGGSVIVVATAQALDDEMRARIAAHRRLRPLGWRTIEEPLDLAGAVHAAQAPGQIVLVDCLTLWLSNLLLAEHDVPTACARLLATLADLACPTVLVSNEVGHGVVPTNALARAFVDHAGTLHQEVARLADEVVLVTAGLPMTLKPNPSGATRA